MVSQIRSILFISSISFLSVSCGHKKEVQRSESYTLRGDTVVVPESSNIHNKLKLYTLKDEPYQLKLISSGTVKAIPNLYAEIAPPFSGRVTNVFLKLGDKVKPGTPLFEMVSPDFIEIQKNYFAAKSELKRAQLNLERQQDLKKNGVGSDKDLEEAEAEYEVIQKEYENAKSGLKIFNANPNQLTLGQAMVITSPIAGEVIVNEIVNGNYIKDDDAPRAKIAALDKVWVAGQVKEKDIRFIRKLDGAEIQIAAYPARKIIGKVYHVEEIVDEETRSVKVLIECPNDDRILKPGMYVTVNFIDAPASVLFVPAKALLQMDNISFVYLQTSVGKYIRRKVETGATENGRIVITEGLKAGDIVLGEGGFYLLEAK